MNKPQNNTPSTTEEWEKELKQKLDDRFGEYTTIGENRYAKDFLEEIVFPFIRSLRHSAYQEGYREGATYERERLMKFLKGWVKSDPSITGIGLLNLLTPIPLQANEEIK